MSTPLITIGIVTYNRLHYLREALESALNQTGNHAFELLIVNDGSTDGTKEYLETFAPLSNTRSIHLSKNQGRPAARNVVIDVLQTPFLLWLDDDDVLVSNALTSQLAALHGHADADILYGNVMVCDENLQQTGERRFHTIDSESGLLELLFDNVVPNPGTVIRKSVFEKIGCYDVSLSRAQDYDLWVRAMVAKCKFVHNDTFICRCRTHQDNFLNPENDKLYQSFRSQVIQKLVANTPLEQIFPDLDWAANPKDSAAKALTILASGFFRFQDYRVALETLKLSEEFHPTKEATALKGLAHQALGQSQQAADFLAQAVLSYDPNLRTILFAKGEGIE